MANGHTALRLVEPSTPPAKGVLIEAEIGEAMAAACATLSQGIVEQHEVGRISPQIRSMSGERIAKLFFLQQQCASGFDFNAIARREGRRALRQIFDADVDYRARHGAQGGEVLIDTLIDGTLEILDRVIEFERAMAN